MCTVTVADSGRMLVNAYVAGHTGLVQASANVAVTGSVVLDIIDVDSNRVVSGGVPALHPIIGRPVRLRAHAHDSATYAVSAAVWTLPGGAPVIKNYDVTIGRLDSLQSADLSGERLRFYFVASEVVQIPVRATLTNKQNHRTFSRTATALYFPAGPTNVSVQAKPTPSGVTVGLFQRRTSDTIGLSLGQTFSGGKCGRGMHFKFSATAPDGDGNGYVSATQLTRYSEGWTQNPAYTGPVIQPQTSNGPYYLDDCPLYGDAKHVSKGSEGGKQYRWTDADSPGTALDTSANQYTRADAFTTRFMYRPGGRGSIWVPIGEVTWHWGGTATRTNPPGTQNGGWTGPTNATYSRNPRAVAFPNFPTWTMTAPGAGSMDGTCPRIPSS
jgi:hypothetical protein